VADAMFAPVAQRFLTYAVRLSAKSAAYCDWSNDWPLIREWIDAARQEEDEVEELEIEF
jgi:glutathione S-transferase